MFTNPQARDDASLHFHHLFPDVAISSTLITRSNSVNPKQIKHTMAETVRPAFADRELPQLSYGIPFYTAAARHVKDTFQASRIYIICSGSLARNTQAFQQLKTALGDRVVGQRIGMKSHTLWSEVVEVVNDARIVNADLLITLGAGSLTDGAKIIAIVCNSILFRYSISRYLNVLNLP